MVATTTDGRFAACPDCRGWYRINRDGTIRQHERAIHRPDFIRYEACPGSGTDATGEEADRDPDQR